MKIIRGDLISLAQQGRFDVIVHGCNCECRMGAGVALAIRQHFPEAFQADCATTPGDVTKLGSYSSARCDRSNHVVIVINAYTQRSASGPGVLVDYEAMRMVMQSIKRDYSGKRIGYPKIGAGLGRGDWSRIAAIIDEELEGEDHTLVEFDR